MQKNPKYKHTSNIIYILDIISAIKQMMYCNNFGKYRVSSTPTPVVSLLFRGQ